MSHTPLLQSGGVIKRKLNCIRPVPGGGPTPPPTGLTFYFAETLVPIPPFTVMGPALTERNLFASYLSTVSPETFESFFAGAPLDDEVLTSNGQTFHYEFGSFAGCESNTAGRFNTTPAGFLYSRISSDPVTAPAIVFDTPVAGFGAYFTDLGDFDQAWTATIYDEFNVPTVVPIGHALSGPSGSLVFWGWLDNTGLLYSRLVFTPSDPGGLIDAVGIDDIITPSTVQITY